MMEYYKSSMKFSGLSVYRSAAEIRGDVRSLAARINADYRSGPATVVGVLSGAFVFLSDLVRHLDFPLRVDFIHVESYRAGTRPGDIALRCGPVDLTDRRVLLVEDIVDTGKTARFLMDHVSTLGAASCDLCALLDKEARREVDVAVDYAGLAVPDRFFVGYGMDLDGRYRNLPDICTVEDAVS